LSYSAQTLHSDRYYGSAFSAQDGFTKGRIGTACQKGKVYDFLFGCLIFDFFLALHAAAKRLYNFPVKIWLRNSKGFRRN